MQKTISEFLENILAIRNERLRNPLFRNVIFILITLNWKTIFVLIFSSTEASERLELAQKFVLPLKEQIFISLSLAVLFVLLGPWLSFLIARVQVIPNKKFKKELIDLEKSVNENKRDLYKSKFYLEIQRDVVESEWNIQKRILEAEAAIKEEEAKKAKIDNDNRLFAIQNEIETLEQKKSDLVTQLGVLTNQWRKKNDDEPLARIKASLNTISEQFRVLNKSMNENFGKSKAKEIEELISRLIAVCGKESSVPQEIIDMLRSLKTDMFEYVNNDGKISSFPGTGREPFIQKYKYLENKYLKILDEIRTSIP